MSMDDSEQDSARQPNPHVPAQSSWLSFGRRLAVNRPESIDVRPESSPRQTSSPGPNSPLFSATPTPTGDYGTLSRSRSNLRIGASRRSSTSPSSPFVPLPGAGGGGPSHLSRVSSGSIFRNFRRPKSTYDRVLEQSAAEDENTYINGIRFYYSTYTSIDWLHDAIKDSTRILSLRRRQSLRGRITNAVDRSLGTFAIFSKLNWALRC